jgi:hypothetical protein
LVFAVEGGNLRPLSRQNDWLRSISLAPVEEVSFRSRDGTPTEPPEEHTLRLFDDD